MGRHTANFAAGLEARGRAITVLLPFSRKRVKKKRPEGVTLRPDSFPTAR
jgi:hypothetical protein